MSSVFKLLIAIIVFGVLVYLILTLFVFKSESSYFEISKSVKAATLQTGDPVCSKVDIKKEDVISTKILLQQSILKDMSIFVWFSGTLNKNYEILPSEEQFTFVAKDNFKQLDFCSVCFPGILFSDYPDLQNTLVKNDLFCEVVFGFKLSALNYTFPIFNSNELQGYHKLDKTVTNLPTGFEYKVFILNNENNQTLSKETLAYMNTTKDIYIEKTFSFKQVDLQKDINIEIPKAGEKIILQSIQQSNMNPYIGVVLPAKLQVQSVDVLPNEDYQKQDCRATSTQKKYIDYEKNMCVVYNYCDGCTLASYCSDVWVAKGQSVEPESSTYAISYLPIEECG